MNLLSMQAVADLTDSFTKSSLVVVCGTANFYQRKVTNEVHLTWL
jgi:hypothetical protein